MKKLFLSILAVMGTLSVFVGPIEVHAQPVEIAPMCLIGVPNRVMWRANRATIVFATASGTGTLDGNVLSAGQIVLGRISGNLVSGRRHIYLNGQTGWVNAAHLDHVNTC